MSAHIKRIATALILLPLLVWLVMAGGLWLDTGLALISALAMREFIGLFRTKAINLINAYNLGFSIASFFIFSPENMSGMFFLLFFFFWGLSFIFMWQYSKNKELADFKQIAISITGFIYITCSLHLFGLLQPIDIAVLLACAFASDTGAFYCGRFWGNKKIWPTISPKKTWAGSLGGLGLCVVIATIAGGSWGQVGLGWFVILGTILSVGGQLGDFFESALKRWTDIKDSGSILPGHGGLLDRIDSILLALPLYCLLNQYINFF